MGLTQIWPRSREPESRQEGHRIGEAEGMAGHVLCGQREARGMAAAALTQAWPLRGPAASSASGWWVAWSRDLPALYSREQNPHLPGPEAPVGGPVPALCQMGSFPPPNNTPGGGSSSHPTGE